MDRQLTEVASRASGSFGPPGAQPRNGIGAPGGQRVQSRPTELKDFVTKGPQPGTIAAKVVNGSVADAQRGEKSTSDLEMNAKTLTKAQLAALGSVSQDGKPHTVDIPGEGEYRVEYKTGDNGSYYVAVPTSDVNSTINTLILVEVSVTAAGLIAAGIAGSVLVGLALRPLRKVASTATRVSELPLHTGEVTLYERVPESEADPHTEVGQVGAALNRMLDHIHSALHARQQSEMRVRQFVADASHELRTPLASIRGYAELTRRGREETGPDTRHALGRIESEAGRMTLLVDLLLLARLDAGRPLQYDQTDLVPLVIDAVERRPGGRSRPANSAARTAGGARAGPRGRRTAATGHGQSLRERQNAHPARYDRHRTRAPARTVAVRGRPGRRARHPARPASARLERFAR